jgi:hypothetical protein
LYLELDVDDLAEDLVGHLEHLDLPGQQRRVARLLQLPANEEKIASLRVVTQLTEVEEGNSERRKTMGDLLEVTLEEVKHPLVRLRQLHERTRAGTPQLGEQLRVPCLRHGRGGLRPPSREAKRRREEETGGAGREKRWSGVVWSPVGVGLTVCAGVFDGLHPCPPIKERRGGSIGFNLCVSNLHRICFFICIFHARTHTSISDTSRRVCLFVVNLCKGRQNRLIS